MLSDKARPHQGLPLRGFSGTPSPQFRDPRTCRTLLSAAQCWGPSPTPHPPACSSGQVFPVPRARGAWAQRHFEHPPGPPVRAGALSGL